MGTSFRKPVAPSADKRWKIVETSMRRLGNQSHALIEALHTVQEAFGYLDADSLRFVATSLRVPLESGLWGGDVLSLLHHEAPRQAHLRGLHGHGLLHQGGGEVADRHGAAIRNQAR